MCNIYGPNKGTGRAKPRLPEDRVKFWERVHTACRKVRDNCGSLLVCGDLNITSTDMDREQVRIYIYNAIMYHPSLSHTYHLSVSDTLMIALAAVRSDHCLLQLWLPWHPTQLYPNQLLSAPHSLSLSLALNDLLRTLYIYIYPCTSPIWQL